MRKIFTIIILAKIAFMSSYSQINKGTILLGGSSSFNYTGAGQYNLYLNPNLGYFFSEQICLGASLPLGYFSAEYNNGYYVGISPFLRYYFGDNDKTRLFTMARVNIKINKDFYFVNNGLVDLGVGYSWFINESIAFETELIGNIFPEKVTAGLYFGFQIYLNR